MSRRTTLLEARLSVPIDGYLTPWRSSVVPRTVGSELSGGSCTVRLAGLTAPFG